MMNPFRRGRRVRANAHVFLFDFVDDIIVHLSSEDSTWSSMRLIKRHLNIRVIENRKY